MWIDAFSSTKKALAGFSCRPIVRRLRLNLLIRIGLNHSHPLTHFNQIIHPFPRHHLPTSLPLHHFPLPHPHLSFCLDIFYSPKNIYSFVFWTPSHFLISAYCIAHSPLFEFYLHSSSLLCAHSHQIPQLRPHSRVGHVTAQANLLDSFSNVTFVLVMHWHAVAELGFWNFWLVC